VAALRHRPTPLTVAVGTVVLILLAVSVGAARPLSRVHEPEVPLVDAAGGLLAAREEPVPLDALDFITILVVGMDGHVRHAEIPPGREKRFSHIPLEHLRGLTDTLMVLGLDRRTHTVRVLRIPRDTIVTLPGRGPDKIAHVMAYFSFFELKRQVEELLQIPVNRYVIVDYAGFKTLVDAIGGVTVTVDHDLLSPEGVWLTKGTHRLDGTRALRFVRHRYGERAGDIARIRLQNEFLRAVGRELVHNGFTKALSAYAASPSVVKTNLSLLEVVGLWREWRDFDPDDIVYIQLPGTVESHYWRPDPLGVTRAVREFWPDEPFPGKSGVRPGSARRQPAASFVCRLVELVGLDRSPPRRLTYAGLLQGCRSQGPAAVVVYHTHTTESFMPELFPDPAVRRDHDPDREAFSADRSLNVVRVGKELADRLADLGLAVRHIRTVHDPGGWSGRSGAYFRARKSLMAELGAVHSPVVVLDIHRDAVSHSTPVGGDRAASVLFVVGRHNPWWQWNYVFARNLSSGLSAVAPGLSRGVCILDGCYNEDLSPLALLVEIGGVDSTMQECLTSARILAGVLADCLGAP